MIKSIRTRRAGLLSSGVENTWRVLPEDNPFICQLFAASPALYCGILCRSVDTADPAILRQQTPTWRLEVADLWIRANHWIEPVFTVPGV